MGGVHPRRHNVPMNRLNNSIKKLPVKSEIFSWLFKQYKYSMQRFRHAEACNTGFYKCDLR
jgi:hypothetical protein